MHTDDVPLFSEQVTNRLREYCQIIGAEGAEALRVLEHEPTKKLLTRFLGRVAAAAEEVEAHAAKHDQGDDQGGEPAPEPHPTQDEEGRERIEHAVKALAARDAAQGRALTEATAKASALLARFTN